MNWSPRIGALISDLTSMLQSGHVVFPRFWPASTLMTSSARNNSIRKDGGLGISSKSVTIRALVVKTTFDKTRSIAVVSKT